MSTIAAFRRLNSALADSVVAEGRSQVAGLEQRVREQPLMALGLAFAAGLLFAKLSGR